MTKKKKDGSARVVLTILSSNLFLIKVLKIFPSLKCQINGDNFDTLQYPMCTLLLARVHTCIISFITKHRYNFLFLMPKAKTETTGRD